MLAVEEGGVVVVVYSMGYLGIRLGVHGRGGEAGGVASVGEGGGGGEVVKKREERLDARPTARWREGVVR